MPDLLHKLLSSWGPECRLAYCRFVTAAGAQPTVLDSKGCTVTRTATGRFNVATVSPCKQMYVVPVTGGTAAQAAIERTGSNNAQTGAVDISVVTAASATEVDTTGVIVTVFILQRMNG